MPHTHEYNASCGHGTFFVFDPQQDRRISQGEGEIELWVSGAIGLQSKRFVVLEFATLAQTRLQLFNAFCIRWTSVDTNRHRASHVKK